MRGDLFMGDNIVTVIIPTYNAENTIDRCIESIVNQTYSKLKIICCDDCSTDNTWAKLVTWQKKDSRITILKNTENMGAAYTRNRCIELATDIVVQIDDDDYCTLDRIEKQVAFLNTHTEYAFVGSGMYFFDEDGVYGQTEDDRGYEVKKEHFLWSSGFANPTVTFRKEALDAVGGYRVAKETRRSQDYDLFMRLYAAGYKGYVMPDKLVYYYRGKNSYRKCKYKYRINEAKIRFRNYKALQLLPRGLPYVIKPILVGLIPISIIEKIKRSKRQKAGIR